MWAIVGEVEGVPVRVSFDGTLDTDGDTRERLQAYADRWEHVGVTPVGPYLAADLTDESSAFLLALTVLSRAELVDGDVPSLPDLASGEIN